MSDKVTVKFVCQNRDCQHTRYVSTYQPEDTVRNKMVLCPVCNSRMVYEPMDSIDETNPSPPPAPRTGIDVLPPGEWVEFVDSKVKGTISQVSLAGKQKVQYQVAWWSGNDRKEQWVNPWEIRPTNNQPLARIGFASGGCGSTAPPSD